MHFAMPCLIKPDMHHTWLCIMPCLCDGCLLCCLLLSGLLLSLASVSFRSCEDSFDYVCLSSSWTRSSYLRDFRQDDHYPRYHFYLCLLVVRSIVMLGYLPLAIRQSCWSCFTIVEMSCNRDSESNRVFLGEGISFVDHESL